MALIDYLSDGGYTLYVRHAQATAGSDQPTIDFSDCRTQRNLSAYGRWQAREYGDALRTLQIPLEYPIIASPFCRTIETAALAFGEPYIEIDPFWVNVYLLSTDLLRYERRRMLSAIDAALEARPERNRVIVAHSFPPGMGLGPIADMETIVIRPYGRGHGYHIVGRLPLDALMRLAR